MTNFGRYVVKATVAGLLSLCLVLSAYAHGVCADQEQMVDPKVLERIAGNYEFEFQGRLIVFVFIVEDGKLLGGPDDEDPEILEPMEGKETTFVGHTPDGIEYQFAFKKDAEGKFTTLVGKIPDMGIEFEGTRIK